MSAREKLPSRCAKLAAREAIVRSHILRSSKPFQFSSTVFFMIFQRKTSKKKDVPITPVHSVAEPFSATLLKAPIMNRFILGKQMSPKIRSEASIAFYPRVYSTPQQETPATESNGHSLTKSAPEESISVAEPITISDASVISVEGLNYTFSMLQTDDSTDNEADIALELNKRPPPPKWSLAINRHPRIVDQSKLPHELVDQFFGQLSEVDLREIFPMISPKHMVRRESSYCWHTPPIRF